MSSREQLAKDNGMTIEFVNWFFDNKKDGCGNVWFMMMAAMWEGWSGREAKCAALAAEVESVKSAHQDAVNTIMYTANRTGVLYTEKTIQMSCKTPATDAYLAEVRAQGVEMVIAYHRERADALHHVDRNNAIRHSMAALDASDIAAQLRQEAAQ